MRLAAAARSCTLVIFLLLTGHGASQCYYPGGTYASGEYPCDPYAFTTLCCPTGWTCLSNKLCVLEDQTYSNGPFSFGSLLRGTCTNPNWNETACGDFCLGNPVNDDTGSMVSRGDGSFCCGPDATAGTCDCSNNLGTINLGSGEPVAVIDGSNGGYSTTGLPYTASADFPSSSTSAMSSSTSATSGSTLTTAVSSFGPSSTTSSAALPLNSGTSVRPQSSSAAASSAEISVIDTDWFKGVIAVVAVLCIALIGLIVWCCWLGPLGRRRRERRQNDSASQKEPKPVSVNPEYQADPHPLHQEPAIVPNPYAQSSTTINNSRQYVGRDPVGQSFDRGNANQYQPAMTDGLSDIDDDDGSEAGPSYLANQSYIDGAYDSTPQATAFTMSQEPLRMASRRKPVGSSKFARSPAPFSPTDVGNPYAEPSPFARPSSGQPYTRYGDRPHQRPPSYRTMASPSSAPSLRRGASDAMDHAYERRSRTPGPSGTIREE